MTLDEIGKLAGLLGLATGAIGWAAVQTNRFVVGPGRSFIARIDSGLLKVDAIERSQVDLSLKVDRIDSRGRANVARLRAFTAFGDALFEVDEDGRCVYANRALEIMTGYSIVDLANLGFVNVIHPDEQVAFTDEWMRMVAQRRAIRREVRIRKFDGVVVPVHFNAEPMRCHEGDIVGWVVKLDVVTR